MNKFNVFMLTAALCLATLPVSVSAETVTTFDQDQTYLVNGATLMAKAGSVSVSITEGEGSLTVTVPDGEVFELVAVYPTATYLENDVGLPMCRILPNKDNQLMLRGPLTATIRPNTLRCNTDVSATSNAPQLTLAMPAVGERLKSGDVKQLFWQTGGVGAAVIRLRLSVDGGSSYTVPVIADLYNNGFYQWTVPSVVTTERARLKIEARDGSGSLVALGLSPVFAIDGLAPPATVEPTPVTYDYHPTVVTAAASSIDGNQGWMTPAGATLTCEAGLRIKGASSAAVYYCGADGKRHAFPNQRIYDSWFAGDFSGVVTVTDASLASVQLGANVKYRPGVRLVKIQTDPKVYAVAANGLLRWVPDEVTAMALYGVDWNQRIDDVPDSFFADYHIGEPIAAQ